MRKPKKAAKAAKVKKAATAKKTTAKRMRSEPSAATLSVGAPATTTAASRPVASPGGYRAKVRMYRQGLGDCNQRGSVNRVECTREHRPANPPVAV